MSIKNLKDKLARELFPGNFYRLSDERLATLTVRWVVIIFIISLFFPAIKVTREGLVNSFMLMFIGGFGVILQLMCCIILPIQIITERSYESISQGFQGILNIIPWDANPLMLISLFLLKKSKVKAFILSVISTALMLSFLWGYEVHISESGPDRILSYQAGYWLWLLSSLALLAGAALLVFRKKREFSIM